MANETLLTDGYDGMINSEYLDPLIADALRDPVVATPTCRFVDLRGKATKTGSFNRRTRDSSATLAEIGTPANVVFDTTKVQVTGAKFGIRRTISEEVMQLTIEGEAGVTAAQAKDAGEALAEDLETDVCALFPSFTSAVSHAGLAHGWPYHLEAMAKMRTNKCPGSPKEWVSILDDQAAADLEQSVAAAGGAVFGQGGTQAILGGGDGAGAMGPLFNVPCFSTNLTTVSGGNGSSAMMVDGRKIEKYAPIGLVLLWMPKTMMAPDLDLVAHGFVHHMAAGVGIIHPSTGTKIVVRG